MSRMHLCSSLVVLFASTAAFAQQAPQRTGPAQTNAPAAKSESSGPIATNAEFLRTSEEVLQKVSRILHLPIKEPLKQSVRTRAQIREYLVKEQQEDKDAAKRYADQRAMEAFGLIPPNFPLESFVLDLLTDQVAGLYDPKASEFYIADWTSPEDQKPVMAHELAHALDDQYFHIDKWEKAARPNDDAESARDAVVEGSALAAMFDYMLEPQGLSVRILPDISGLTEEQAREAAQKDPLMKKAPPYLRDDLLFPYIAGCSFTQAYLKASTGWADFHKVFENPPVSTQQILHPEMYFAGVKPLPISIPPLHAILPRGWKELDENVMGEFGLKEILSQYLDSKTAEKISPYWAADRYAIVDSPDKKSTLLIYCLRLESDADAEAFFKEYSALLAKKHPSHTTVLEGPSILDWSAPEGAVALECRANECISVEGADDAFFTRLLQVMNWPPVKMHPAPAANTVH